MAECGLGSRRKCEKLVLDGKVKVNGTVVKDLFRQICPEDNVTCSGTKIKPQPKIVIALNKPPGFLCTLKDDFKRKKVTDLIDENVRIYPAGRLDYNSRGLLIMTNDGNLSYKLTHPKFKIPKTYKVNIEGALKNKDINKIIEGIAVDDTVVGIISFKITHINKNNTTAFIEIVEGRKRIIRKLFKKLGHEVLDLQRVKIGNFKLQNLKEGHYMVLNKEQVEKLTAGLH